MLLDAGCFQGVRPPVAEQIHRGERVHLLDGQQQLIGVWALDIAGGQITRINVIVNPDKLTHLGPVGDFRSLLRP